MNAVFRCDYCGTHAPLERATLMWRWVEDLDNGDEVYTSAIYCSTYCGVRAAGSIVDIAAKSKRTRPDVGEIVWRTRLMEGVPWTNPRKAERAGW